VVECDLAKVEVAGSNPVSRSRIYNLSTTKLTSARIVSNIEESAPMNYRTSLCALAFGATSLALGCGGNELKSVMVSPAKADARNFPNAQVQFSATGVYGSSSKPVPATNLTWCVGTSSGICNGNIASAATVNGNGVAQCLPGTSGTVNVIAGTGGSAPMPDTGQQLKVFGTAQLTCP
jgi:hypothetical protein